MCLPKPCRELPRLKLLQAHELSKFELGLWTRPEGAASLAALAISLAGAAEFGRPPQTCVGSSKWLDLIEDSDWSSSECLGCNLSIAMGSKPAGAF